MNRKPLNRLRSEQGSIFSVVLLIVILLVSAVIYGVMSTNTELKISSNERLQDCALYAAEAGIDLGRVALNDLKEKDKNGWNVLLYNDEQRRVSRMGGVASPVRDFSDTSNNRSINTAYSGMSMPTKDSDQVLWALVATRKGGVWETAEETKARILGGIADKGGNFSLTVVDDLDFDGSGPGNSDPLVDTNDIVILTSRGTCGSSEVLIQTEVRYDGSSGEYAQLHQDSGSNAFLKGQSQAANLGVSSQVN